ncbi:hypothetical protein H0H92_001418 [Tricholoma furcatifolium]|nr:hypothetical protein H0H92_001418 [Tricholoma furcatifolium]
MSSDLPADYGSPPSQDGVLFIYNAGRTPPRNAILSKVAILEKDIRIQEFTDVMKKLQSAKIHIVNANYTHESAYILVDTDEEGWLQKAIGMKPEDSFPARSYINEA